MTESHVPHKSVMCDQMLAGFEGCNLRVMVDCTLGAGGHAEAILEAHPEIECFIGIDQDPDALALSQKRLERFGDRVKLVRANFSQLDQVLDTLGIEQVDGFFLT